MTTLNQLYPQPLWQWFETICSIPHPSKHEQALSAYIKDWAQSINLSITEDDVGNLIICKPATKGMENRQTVALQAHLDMVPQKNADIEHEFAKDPIHAYVDGEWVKAKSTTLGADNGIGMASALALLASTDIPHGPLEVLLTIDEETGMTGAFGLKAGVLKADILINTDSEQEGEIYMGCAGGVDAQISQAIEWETSTDAHAFTLTLKGLKGGHSGVNIHLGRGNANKLLARFIYDFINKNPQKLSIANLQGGTLRNAIPREAQATLITSDISLLQKAVNDYQSLLKAELAGADPDVELILTSVNLPEKQFTHASATKLMQLIHACPNGVIRMSDEIEEVVETSLNLGVIHTENDNVIINCLIRSLMDSGREQVEGTLTALAALADASITLSGTYPGWKPDNSSPIMKIVSDTYQDIYHKEPAIMVIHAGLECGLFKKPYPNMDMVSVGPTIRFPHSPDEMVNIETVGQYWDLLLEVLKRIPNRH